MPDFPNCSFNCVSFKVDEIELEIGRPRTEAYIVYVFLMLRGLGRWLQRPVRPLVAGGVYDAQTLA
jgi:hypothetical protein